jgi:fluoride exporter
MTPLLVALGAAVGAAARFEVASRLDGRFPTGTLAVNVVGSFLLGLLSALAVGEHPLALLGTGFCGGFTTYSAFAVQTHDLGRVRASAYVVATIGGGLLACALGWWLGRHA